MRYNSKDLSGKKFNMLTVIKLVGSNKKGNLLWLCKCECGGECVATSYNITHSVTKSCGCLKKVGNRLINRVGCVFGNLTVIERVDNNEGGRTRWLCKCSCGNERIVLTDMLVSGSVVSCGCKNKTRLIDLTGKTFGRLKVLRRAHSNIKNIVFYECLCECGNVCVIRSQSLKNGSTQSCGCYHSEQASKNMKDVVSGVKGELHPKYRNDISPDDRKYGRYGKSLCEYIKWRNDVYERDDYTCAVCNRHLKKLNAHHIKSWVDNEECRFDIKNGVTLCVKCHNKFHSLYGRGYNTEEQWNEYKNKRNQQLLQQQ